MHSAHTPELSVLAYAVVLQLLVILVLLLDVVSSCS